MFGLQLVLSASLSYASTVASTSSAKPNGWNIINNHRARKSGGGVWSSSLFNQQPTISNMNRDHNKKKIDTIGSSSFLSNTGASSPSFDEEENSSSFDEEEDVRQMEMAKLTSNASNIIWLNNERSSVNHRKLENSHITLRGGGGHGDATTTKTTKQHDNTLSKGHTTDKRLRLSSTIAKWYMNQMEHHELRTKCVSAGILGVVGDICAQEVGRYLLMKSMDGSDDTGEIDMASIPSGLDKQRMLAMFFDGLLTTGPLLHFVYEMYERILPIPEIPTEIENNNSNSNTNTLTKQQQQLDKASITRKRFLTALVHVSFDNFIMAVLYVFLMMVATAIFEGRYLHIPHELQHDFVPAVKASWTASLCGLAPMQLMSFHFLPMELRVLAVNVQDVIWVTVMSYVTHRNRH